MGSIHGPILRSLLAAPFRERIVDDRRSYRAIDLLVASLHVASAIKSKCDSQTVGVLMPTGAGFPIAALASWCLGKTVVPLNYLLKQDELQYIIDDSGMDTLVTAQPMLDFMGYTPRVKHLIKLDQLDFKSFPEPIMPTFADGESLGVLLYTSGTSGKPKGVMLSHNNVCANIDQVRDWIDITKDFVFLGVLPQFHSFGMTALTLVPLVTGSKAVYTARFVPGKIIKLMREHKPKVFVAIPSMYNALLHVKDATRDDFANITYMVSGGEPLPKAVFDAMRERFGVTLAEGYGLTETSPVTNWCRPQEWREHSVGRPLPRLEERIVDPVTGKTLGPNQDGEVQMRGPNVMQGYYKLPDETAKAFTADGFFKSGDIGRHDDEGHLFITGRLKEMIIVGGENVFPREIEEVLNTHPAVNATGVIGVHDPMRGEQPVAFVEFKENASAEEKDLLAHCRTSLAGYKIPAKIHVVDQLPRNATGKIMRRELKKLVTK